MIFQLLLSLMFLSGQSTNPILEPSRDIRLGDGEVSISVKGYKDDPDAIISNAKAVNINESVSYLLDIIEKPDLKVLDVLVINEDKAKAVAGLALIYYKLNMYPFDLMNRSLKTLYEIILDSVYPDEIRELSTFSYALLGQNELIKELNVLANKDLIGDDFKKAILGVKGLSYIYSKDSTEALIRILNTSNGDSDFCGYIDEKGKFTKITNNPIPRIALEALALRGVNPTNSIFNSLEFIQKEFGDHGKTAREAVVSYSAKHKGFEDIRKGMVDARIEDFGKHMVYILGNLYVFTMTVGMGWIAEAKEIATINATRLYNTSYNQAGTIRLTNTLKVEETMRATKGSGTLPGRDVPFGNGLENPLVGRGPYIEPTNPIPVYPEDLPLYPQTAEPFYIGSKSGTAVLTEPSAVLTRPIAQDGFVPTAMTKLNIEPASSFKTQILNTAIKPQVFTSTTNINPLIATASFMPLSASDQNELPGLEREKNYPIVFVEDDHTYIYEPETGNYYIEGDPNRKKYIFDEVRGAFVLLLGHGAWDNYILIDGIKYVKNGPFWIKYSDKILGYLFSNNRVNYYDLSEQQSLDLRNYASDFYKRLDDYKKNLFDYHFKSLGRDFINIDEQILIYLLCNSEFSAKLTAANRFTYQEALYTYYLKNNGLYSFYTKQGKSNTTDRLIDLLDALFGE